MLGRGLTKRCPVCGGGRLFTGWFKMKDCCPRCGYRFEREEGFQLGGYVINFGVTEGLVCLVVAGYILAASQNPDTSIWPVVIAGAIAAVVTPIVFYPFSRTIWAAIDLTLTPLTLVEQAEAETAMAARGEQRPEGA
jgi:uncharacterized protein (DUF983 family)